VSPISLYKYVFNLINVAFVPEHVSPIITFAIFAAIGKGTLGTAKMFTTITLITLITSPLGLVFQGIPNIMGAVNCLQRIQKFLQAETKSDHRLLLQGSLNGVPPSSTNEDIELGVLKSDVNVSLLKARTENAVVIQNGTFGWKAEEPILQDISMSIQSSQLTLIIGPVASGKSTLLKALLGETPSSQGFVYISSTEVAFCDVSFF